MAPLMTPQDGEIVKHDISNARSLHTYTLFLFRYISSFFIIRNSVASMKCKFVIRYERLCECVGEKKHEGRVPGGKKRSRI